MINNKINIIKKEYNLNPEIKVNIIEEKLKENQKQLFSMISKISQSIPPNISIYNILT